MCVRPRDTPPGGGRHRGGSDPPGRVAERGPMVQKSFEDAVGVDHERERPACVGQLSAAARERRRSAAVASAAAAARGLAGRGASSRRRHCSRRRPRQHAGRAGGDRRETAGDRQPSAAASVCAGGSRPQGSGDAWTRALVVHPARSSVSTGHDAMLLVVARAQRLLESRESTRSRALDGAEGALERGRHLGFGKVQEVAQDERRALAWRKRRQCLRRAGRGSSRGGRARGGRFRSGFAFSSARRRDRFGPPRSARLTRIRRA